MAEKENNSNEKPTSTETKRISVRDDATPKKSQDMEDSAQQQMKDQIFKGDNADQKELNKLMENPLRGKSREELFKDIDEYCQLHQLEDIKEDLRKGALIAQSPRDFESLDLQEDERAALVEERDYKWRQTRTLYWVIVMNSMAAVVQGMVSFLLLFTIHLLKQCQRMKRSLTEPRSFTPNNSVSVLNPSTMSFSSVWSIQHLTSVPPSSPVG